MYVHQKRVRAVRPLPPPLYPEIQHESRVQGLHKSSSVPERCGCRGIVVECLGPESKHCYGILKFRVRAHRVESFIFTTSIYRVSACPRPHASAYCSLLSLSLPSSLPLPFFPPCLVLREQLRTLVCYYP